MALDKPYKDIPGTTIFDADQSRKGYWLNQFCFSLMKEENRAKFKSNERAYLDEWPMTEEQKQAVLTRDLNWCMRTGGNIYFLARVGATDGLNFQQMAGSMTGLSEEEYRKMMVNGGRSIEGNRYLGEDGDAQPKPEEVVKTKDFAKIVEVDGKSYDINFLRSLVKKLNKVIDDNNQNN